jgi:hypothetical protein
MLQLLYILPTPESFARARPLVWTGRSTLKGFNLIGDILNGTASLMYHHPA